MRFIRPTGNPLSMAGFQDMMKSDLVTRSTNEVLSFEKIHVGTDSAMCCIVHRDIFDYDGHEKSFYNNVMVAQSGGAACHHTCAYAAGHPDSCYNNTIIQGLPANPGGSMGGLGGGGGLKTSTQQHKTPSA